MARKSIIEREKKKLKLTSQYLEKRKSIKEEMRKAETFEEKMEAQKKLQKLPRNSNPNRVVRRCELTGRPKGFIENLGLVEQSLESLQWQGSCLE